jgi:hypothetical protein
MQIVHGPKPIISVVNVIPNSDLTLFVEFSDGEKKTYDFKRELDFPPFKPLANVNFFKTAHVDFGTVIWGDDEVDVSADELYENGIPV